MTTTDDALVVQVRQAIETARRAGRPRPGRPALVRLTGATDYAVRKALATLTASENNTAASLSPTEPTADGSPESTGRPASLHKAAPAVRGARLPRPWPLAVIGLAAAVAIWGGWVRLGELTGFGPINLLPGIGSGLTVNTAVVLPLSVEFYSAYALRVLLASDRLTARTRTFARRTFTASLVVGGGAQVASHVMDAAGTTTAPWPVTTVVACVPLLVLGLASGLASLVKQDATSGEAVQVETSERENYPEFPRSCPADEHP
ncbi:hypothetical protein SacmaDRAFT_0424 [Saccharomonospora marina XMU15]|uniref:Uncharacterized protein n=1 Tax=Saccharomonospora marina XMU15 TaxID=882083 RepID=H5X2D2_9PSEU|nr:hypothetical protein SacmaDRAFT_0424 [Saccharomonospora marina XMU15]